VVLGPQHGQRLALGAFELVGGEAEIVEEGGDVGIALVELIPEARDPGAVEIARRERGLAAPGRTRDPYRRRLAAAVEKLEQALARQDAGEARARGLP